MRRGTQTGKAAKLKPSWLRVRLPPAPLKYHATIGHWQAQLAVTQPSHEDLQVQLLLVALKSWLVRLSVKDTGPSSRKGGFDSRTGCST